MSRLFTLYTMIAFILPLVWAHSAFWHPSMWGFNVTDKTFPYENRPVAPLRNKTFKEWWFHDHLAYPPNQGDFFELPAGGRAKAEIACTKDATSYWNIAPDGGRNTQDGNNPCPGSPSLTYHTNGFDDLKGCALAVAYKSNVDDVKPEDFTIFSVNQTCVWTRFTDFQVPKRMPKCPDEGCICSFFWVHSAKAGGEENYMNGFRCKVTNATSTTPLAKPEVPRRCGADPEFNRQFSVPQNCTYGAKQPFYWLNDNSNMFEGDHAPPIYNDLYNFADGPQDDIFIDSYTEKPAPGIVAPLPAFADLPSIVKHLLSRKMAIAKRALTSSAGTINNDSVTSHLSPRRSSSATLSPRDSAVGQEQLADTDPRLFRRYVPRVHLHVTYASRDQSQP